MTATKPKVASFHRVCDVCNHPQFPSPSGWVCANGHGGAPFHIDEVSDYQQQYSEWFNRIRKEINEPLIRSVDCKACGSTGARAVAIGTAIWDCEVCNGKGHLPALFYPHNGDAVVFRVLKDFMDHLFLQR